MSLRRLIVEVDADDLNVTEFCQRHGISTWFFYSLRRRYRAGGLSAIEPRSRAPHRVANRTSGELEDMIVAVRKELTELGLDAGPVTIADLLADRLEHGPSPSTVYRVLRRRGFIVADPSKRPKRSGRRFTASRANECWQNDDTTVELADGTAVKVINLIDDCTRVVPASVAVPTCTAAAVFDAFTRAAREWGWPERVLSDNAQAHHALHDTFAVLGIATTHPRPYHPQTCGKIERFHQTLKRFLAAQQPSAATLTALQAQLDTFRHYYNHQRRHRAINRQVPAHYWQHMPKSGPADQPLHATTEVHHGTVDRTGVVRGGNRYSIIVGRRHAGTPTTTIITGRACHIFSDGKLLRSLTLDPTRRVQPLNNNRPRP